ncbi:MAG: hypothetical protein ABMA64_24440 [Myxococcota bacterium]
MPDDPTTTSTATGGTTTTSTTGEGPQGFVPSGRLREATARAESAEARATAAEARATAAEAQRQAIETEREVYRAGVTDPEGVEVAQVFYNKLPTENRPEIGAWLGKLTAETAPKGLAAYLPPRPAAATASALATPPAKPATTTAAAPATSAASTGAGAASGGYDAAAIRALREEAVRTGDMSKLRAAMPQILQAVRPR